ncbi:unnamed protein product, partial [Urochloa humidicola]
PPPADAEADAKARPQTLPLEISPVAPLSTPSRTLQAAPLRIEAELAGINVGIDFAINYEKWLPALRAPLLSPSPVMASAALAVPRAPTRGTDVAAGPSSTEETPNCVASSVDRAAGSRRTTETPSPPPPPPSPGDTTRDDL